ncbi:sodium-dependent transporter [Chitinimonas lacunae]|uniref:Transporter n=1 Tax=Chitinimonas lacunae TaxID=1963018 RepID=A0ABV8MV86_9NEIS
MTAARAQWGSRLGFILAAAGSAIGLGAIWKFPYIAGNNGGGAFLLLYIFFSLTIGLTVMLAELALGRAAKLGPVGAFRKLVGSKWALFGYMGVLTGFLIMTFYSVVGGWTLGYLVKAVSGELTGLSREGLNQVFGSFISDPWKPVWYHGLFLLLNMAVVLGGVKSGIEAICKYLMPGLFILMIGLIIRALMLPGAMDGVAFFLLPDFSKVTISTVVEALGFAFFSLSLGMGAMITYGSYLDDQAKLVSSALWVIGLQVACALLAGLMVLPVVFAFGFDPAAGPGLSFITLPAIFDHLPAGQWLGALFFALLLVAALTSSISLIEVVASYFIDEHGMERRKITLAVCLVMFVAGIAPSLSFGLWQDVKPFGRTIFDLLDYLTSNVMLPLGGIAVSICLGWIAWPILARQLPHESPWFMTAIRLGCRWFAPLAIGGVLLKGI